MTQTLFRKSLMLGCTALVAAALSLPVAAEDMAKNPCAKPANPCATKAANPCAKEPKMKKKQDKSEKPANPCAKNPCAAKPMNPCAKK